jgi:pimeloyl-ACP methyl ester carboxylesterase
VEDWWTAGQADVLIVQGISDVSAPVGNGRLLREEIGNRATLIQLTDVGHALPVEKPNLVADTVIHCLRARNEDWSSQHG